MCIREFGLLPLVREFQILSSYGSSSRELFNYCILRQFSALTNIHDFEIHRLDIPKFMPRIKRYLRNFLPTVRPLALREPNGSRRQIIYFIGLFQHLKDLELYPGFSFRGNLAGDLTLIPEFVPPLQGWLRMSRFDEVGLLKDMTELFGEL